MILVYNSLKGEIQTTSINKTRGMLYRLARLLGDLSAISKGKVGKRITRRATGKVTGKALRKLFK